MEEPIVQKKEKQSATKKAELVLSSARIGAHMRSFVPRKARASPLSAVVLAAAAELLGTNLLEACIRTAAGDERKTISADIVDKAISGDAELHIIFPTVQPEVKREEVIKVMKKETRARKNEYKEKKRESRKRKKEIKEIEQAKKELEKAKKEHYQSMITSKAKKAAILAVDVVLKSKKFATGAELALKKKKESAATISKKSKK